MISSLARKYIPTPLYNRLRAYAGHFEYQERLRQLPRPWMAYGLLMATRTARKYGIDSISVAEFGVANGQGLRKMTEYAERLSDQSGVNISVFGFDTGTGMPPPKDYRDNPDQFSTGDFPMPDFELLRSELEGRATLVIGDIRERGNIDEIIGTSGPIGFASIDVDYYSSTKSVLGLLAESGEQSLLPTTGMFFHDVWAQFHYSRFTGQLLAIDEFNEKYDARKLDSDRFVEFWHGAREPWHASMYALHSLSHPTRTQVLTRG